MNTASASAADTPSTLPATGTMRALDLAVGFLRGDYRRAIIEVVSNQGRRVRFSLDAVNAEIVDGVAYIQLCSQMLDRRTDQPYLVWFRADEVTATVTVIELDPTEA